jgi:hypothetical protein
MKLRGKVPNRFHRKGSSLVFPPGFGATPSELDDVAAVNPRWSRRGNLGLEDEILSGF